MMLKYSILLVSFLLLSSAASSQEFDRYSPETLGLIEDATAAIKKLADLIAGAVKSAVDQLNAMFATVMDYAEDLIKKTTDQLGEIAGEYLGKIKEIKEAADQAGVDISHCIGEQEEVIKNMPKQMALDLLSCVTDKINEGKTIISNAIAEIMKIPNIVTELIEKMEGCNGGWFCLGSVIGQAAAETVKIPIAITGQIAKATGFIVTVKSDIVKCGTKQIVQAGLNCTTIVVDITKCFNELINSTTNSGISTSRPVDPSNTNVNRIK